MICRTPTGLIELYLEKWARRWCKCLMDSQSGARESTLLIDAFIGIGTCRKKPGDQLSQSGPIEPCCCWCGLAAGSAAMFYDARRGRAHRGAGSVPRPWSRLVPPRAARSIPSTQTHTHTMDPIRESEKWSLAKVLVMPGLISLLGLPCTLYAPGRSPNYKYSAVER